MKKFIPSNVNSYRSLLNATQFKINNPNNVFFTKTFDFLATKKFSQLLARY